jgi:site-specific recombinase XerD
MPRRPKPWFKKSHNAWYVKIGGKQIRLATDEAGAWKAFHRLMADESPAPLAPPSRRRVIDLFEAWLGSRTGVAEKTLTLNRHFAQSFVASMPQSARAAEVRPAHVAAWLDANPDWSKTTRSIAVRVVKAAYRWAVFEEWMPRDPLARLKAPKAEVRPPAAPALVEQVLGEVSPAARELFRFMYMTGARPGEAISAEASGVDVERRTVRVVGKMGERLVVFPAAYGEFLRGLVAARPSGPLFVNSRGGRWTNQAMRAQIGRAKRRLGLTGKFVPYHLRGIFASERIAAGADSSVVGKMLGHSSPLMLHKHYHNPDLDTMRDAADLPPRDKKTRPKPGD